MASAEKMERQRVLAGGFSPKLNVSRTERLEKNGEEAVCTPSSTAEAGDGGL